MGGANIPLEMLAFVHMKKIALLVAILLAVGAVVLYTKATRPVKKVPADAAGTAAKELKVEEINYTEVEYVEDPVPEKAAK